MISRFDPDGLICDAARGGPLRRGTWSLDADHGDVTGWDAASEAEGGEGEVIGGGSDGDGFDRSICWGGEMWCGGAVVDGEAAVDERSVRRGERLIDGEGVELSSIN